MTSADSPARALGAFLRARREQTRPEDLGLEPGARRRVDGLRREEVAVLAALSPDYYQRLEQGRNVRPTDAVADSLADALALDDVHRRHLLQLVRATRRPAPTVSRPPERVPAATRALLAALDLPALVVGRHLDALAWNPLAAALLGDPEEVPADQRNVLFALFRDEDEGQLFADCETVALDYIGMLRTAVAQDPDHPRAAAVVGRLSVRSSAFRRLWARHEVRDHIHGLKTIRHPRVGDLEVEWNAYPLPGSPGPSMIVYTPRPGHEDRVRMLAALTTTTEPETTAAASGSVRDGLSSATSPGC